MKYQYDNFLPGFDSWFLQISEDTAKKLNRMKIRVFVSGSDGSQKVPCLIPDPEKWEEGKQGYRDDVLNVHLPKKARKRHKVIYWIPVTWYDRFTGKEVEAFDTVRGLEEYNHRFENF